ncbi:MAG: hypothetical protein FJ146_11825 [Deltaproteobacteria bacterium]|nr:hypothetical protein [Deltaproteobacteria bacterium]
MRVKFNESDRNIVLEHIKAALGQRKLADLLDFSVSPGSLIVKISKLGTSELSFTEKPVASGLEYTLTGEKIALAHRAFKGEVTEKIIKIVEKAGGTVVA